MIRRLIKSNESFVKYAIGGVFKTGTSLLLLYIFIDRIDLPWPNTITRSIIFGTIFLVTFQLYKIIGYSKN